MKSEHVLKAIGVGALVLLAQHLLADESESWLKKLGLWPTA